MKGELCFLKKILFSICIVFCCVAVPVEGEQGDPLFPQDVENVKEEESWRGFLPNWEIGMTWDVKFRQWKAFPDNPDERELSGPFVLRFEVTQIHEDLNPVRVVIRVSDPEDEKKYDAALVFLAGFNAEGRVSDLALARYQFRHTMFTGNKVENDKRPHQLGKRPYPVLTGDIFVPFDFPYMSIAHSGENTKEIEESFEALIPSPGFMMEGDVIQRVRRAGRFLELPEFSQNFDPAPCLEFIFSRRMDGAYVRQIWHPDYPWCVWAEGSNGRAELLIDSVKRRKR